MYGEIGSVSQTKHMYKKACFKIILTIICIHRPPLKDSSLYQAGLLATGISSIPVGKSFLSLDYASTSLCIRTYCNAVSTNLATTNSVNVSFI